LSRQVRLATCQPPAPTAERSTADIQAQALDLLHQAAEADADLCCLPECLNVIGCEPSAAAELLGGPTDHLLAEASRIAAESSMYVALPLILRRGAATRNTTVLLGLQGQEIGTYDKVHLSETERTEWGLTAGDSFPVFELDFGRVGLMSCYDVCFPECARLLALGGADVILFSSLQRGYTEEVLALQVRARAYDNCVYIVRSSYGTPAGEVWRPGTMVGKSCITAPDGTIIADLGRRTGMIFADVDLDQPEIAERSFGGTVGVRRTMQFADRRPETYGKLCQPAP